VVSAGASLRKGDRVVACLDSGLVAANLKRRTARAAELAPIAPGEPERVIPAAEIRWMARVMWVRH
jgi:phage repressor protein C with HTH and peptisase S24 domain